MLLNLQNQAGQHSPLDATLTQPKRRAHPAFFVVLAFFFLMLLAFNTLASSKSAQAQTATICLDDTAGANDPTGDGQKDLTTMCVNYANAPTSLTVTWNWDEISVNGGNTLDACSLFDTDGDGFANYALCVNTTNGTTATTTLYSCGDDRADRCTSPNTPISPFSSTCSVGVQNTDPFSAGDVNPQDMVATCTVQLADVGAGSAQLVDVCSYPSGSPNSSPSDCVGSQAGVGKLEVRKVLAPAGAGLFNLQIDGSTVGSGASVGNGGTTGEQYVAIGSHTLGEVALAPTSLANFTTAIACRDLNGSGALLASGTNASLSVTIVDGTDVVCTITNTLNQGRIIVDKVTLPAGDPTSFGFSLTGGPAPILFALTDAATPYDSGLSLTPGTYSVSEINVPGGWTQDPAQVTCSDGSPATAINLANNEVVTCIFTNKKTPNSSIKVRKITEPAISSPAFGFSASGLTPNTFTLINGAEQLYSNLAPGSYTLSEANVTGWQLKSLTCTGGQITISGSSAVVDLAFDQNVVCTFVNDPLPAISVAKSATPTTVPESGGAVTYHFTVTNNGLEPLTLTSLSDDRFGNLAGQGTCATGSVILVGASYSCSLVKTIAGDYPGSHVNTVTASAVDDENNSASANASATVTFSDVLPSIGVNKSANPGSVAEPGGNVQFTFAIVNTSTEIVSLTSLQDSVFGNLDGQGTCDVTPPVSVAPNGGSYSCTLTKYIAGNFGGADHQNTLTATATDDDGNSLSRSDSETVLITDLPSSLLVTKDADRLSVTEPGGLVNYTVWVTNTSSADTVTITSLLDKRPSGDVDSSAICGLPHVLAPAAGFACSFSYVVSGNNGALHTNTIVAAGTDDDGQTVGGQAVETVVVTNANSELRMSKTPDRTTLPEPGGAVKFTLRFTNTSIADVVTINTLNDSLFHDVTTAGHDGIISTTCAVPQNLAINGGVYECSFIAQISGNAGFIHENTVIATGKDDDGDAVSAVDDAIVTLTNLPSVLTVVKSASPSSVPETGGNVTYTVQIRNDSAVDSITINSVVDDRFGDISNSCGTLPVTLAAAQTLTCLLVTTLPPANAGTTHTNIVTVHATDDDNQPLNPTDPEVVPYSDTPGLLEVIKTANLSSVPENGGDVTFSVLVRNLSLADTITVTSVVDDQFGDIGATCTPSISAAQPLVLLPGASTFCTFTRFLIGNVGTSHVNQVTAHGINDDGLPVSGRDSETVTFSDAPSSMLVSKTANAAGVSASGGVVTFTLRVENNSLADSITLSTLNDSIYGNIANPSNPGLLTTNCAVPQTLPPAGLYQCQFSAVIGGMVGELHTNVLTVTATDSDGAALSGSDSESVQITDPVIVATKSDALLQDANNNGVANPGDVLRYTIVVRNVGNAPGQLAFVNDLLDPNTGLVVGSVSTSQGNVLGGNSAGDTSIRVDIGNIAPGSVVTIRFDVTIDNPLPAGVTQVHNQGLVTGGNFALVLTDDPQTPTPDDPTITPVVAEPLVSASKNDRLVVDADGNGRVSPGDTLEYQIIIVNNGNQAASQVVFTDNPDAYTSLLVGSVQSSLGSVIEGNTAGDTTVEVTVGNLAGNGATTLITFRVRINSPLPAGVTQISNRGLVSGGNFPVVPTDNPETPDLNDPTTTQLDKTPILNAAKRAILSVDADGNGVPSPGDTLSYLITIINTGNTDATGVVLNDQPDPNTVLINATLRTSQGLIIRGDKAGDSDIRVQIGTIAGGGGEVTVSYDVVINNPLSVLVPQVANQGLLSSNELPTLPTDDPSTPDSDDPTLTPVQATPILDVNKSAQFLLDNDQDGIASPGDVLLYTLEVVNRGNSAATNVIISDTVDANTTLVNGSVLANPGVIVSGNNPGDSRVQVTVNAIPGNGGAVKITFKVTINNPLPPQVLQIINQAVVQSKELPPISSDDPARPGDRNPTTTPVSAHPVLSMSKSDILVIDADSNNKVTLGDTLLYRITIVNHGNTAATNVVFSDTLDTQTTLVIGSVQSSAGVVVKGNNAGDTGVVVNVGIIPVNGTVTIVFRAWITSNLFGVIKNQALAEYANPTDNRTPAAPVLSDDPDSNLAGDPTQTVIEAPNALEDAGEPGAMRQAVYLPLIVR